MTFWLLLTFVCNVLVIADVGLRCFGCCWHSSVSRSQCLYHPLSLFTLIRDLFLISSLWSFNVIPLCFCPPFFRSRFCSTTVVSGPIGLMPYCSEARQRGFPRDEILWWGVVDNNTSSSLNALLSGQGLCCSKIKRYSLGHWWAV